MVQPSSTPQPQPNPHPDPSPGTLSWRKLLPRLAAFGGLIVFASWLLAAPRAEQALSPAETMARQATFAQAGALLLAPVASHERAEALRTMQLPSDQQQALESQKSELVWLTVWDDRDEDGDIVAVESDGFRQQVQIAHAPARLALPRPRSGTVLLHGVRDGGGGITVAVQSGGGQIALPPLTVGQAVTIPVR